MEELGFLSKFIAWTMECVQTINYSIMINGESTKPLMQLEDKYKETQYLYSYLQIVMEYLCDDLIGYFET